MPSRIKAPQKKPVVKRLLDGLLTRRALKIEESVDDSVDEDARDQAVTSSSSMLKRHEEVKQHHSTSPEPTLLSHPPTTTESGRQSQVTPHLSVYMIMFRCINISFYM